MKYGLKFSISFILFTLFVFLNTGAELSGETQVSISVSDNLATIGDRIRLKIIIKTTDDVHNISIKPVKKEFEILEQKPEQKRKQQDYLFFEKEIEIAFFKTGEFNVGPFNIDLKKNDKVIETRETNSVPVTIKSVLKEEDKDIKPLKNLIEIKGNPFYILKYVIIAVIVVIAIVLLIMWIKRRGKKPEVKEEPLLSPIDDFELRIKELSEKKLFERGRIKLFFIEFTQIVKCFLNRTYLFNAEDFTTYETLYDLKRCETEVLILNNMEFLLNTADLVKFAKFIPGVGALEDFLKKIADIIAVYRQRISAEADGTRNPRGNMQNNKILADSSTDEQAI